jgi:serine/threonine protein kinase
MNGFSESQIQLRDAPDGVAEADIRPAAVESVNGGGSDSESDSVAVTLPLHGRGKSHSTGLTGSSASAGTEGTDPTSARRFGDYDLLNVISRDDLGVVFKARQVSVDRIVALKLVMGGEWVSESEAQRFYREAMAAADLDHPSIVPIYDVGQHGSQHFVSMGFIEGENLARRMERGTFPPHEGADAVKQIAEAIAAAHSKGVIHGNLTPNNILFNERGHPKVTGFGLTVQRQEDGVPVHTSQILEAPAYLAPEQLSRQHAVNPLTDVYALGAMLYLVLSGRPPFRGANLVETLSKILEQEPIPPRHLNFRYKVPRALEMICSKCLRKRPGDRYATAADLAADLGRWLGGQRVVAKWPSPIERFWRLFSIPSAMSVLRALVFSAALSPVVAVMVLWIAPGSEQANAIRALVPKNAAPAQPTSRPRTASSRTPDDRATALQLAKVSSELARLKALIAVVERNSRGRFNLEAEAKKAGQNGMRIGTTQGLYPLGAGSQRGRLGPGNRGADVHSSSP